jgi:Trp operon repressor
MSETNTAVNLYDYQYPSDYVPVRGDTIRYYDTNWRTGVVLHSQDGEVTFLTPENKTRTFQASNVKVSHDQRMRLLLTLDEEDATNNRVNFLDAFIAASTKREQDEVASKGESASKTTSSKTRMEPKRAAEVNKFVEQVTELILKSDKPLLKTDIVKNVEMDNATYTLVMKKVVAGHKVVKAGKKRGTNYRAAGRSYSD